MKHFRLQAIIFLISLLHNSMYTQTILPKDDPAYELVFSEEFSLDTLDRNKWMPRYLWGHFTNTNTYPVALSSGNGCASLAPPNDKLSGVRFNADTSLMKMSGGICNMKIVKKNAYGHILDANYATDSLQYKYMRGMLSTRYLFKYGYFEIKFKYDYRNTPNGANAYTPTFWLLGFPNDDTSHIIQYSEIDIFEIDATLNQYTSTVHRRKKNFANGKATKFVDNGTYVSGGQWHTAAGHWHSKGIDIYVDDVFRGSWVNDTAALLLPSYFMIDTDSPSMNFCVPIDTVNTQYPYETQVDYVRVYQLRSACDTSKTVCNANLATHPPPKVYQQITDGGSGCSIQLNNGNTGIFGENFVLLDEGFEIGNNAEIYMNVRDCYKSSIQHRFPLSVNDSQPMPQNFFNDHNQNPN